MNNKIIFIAFICSFLQGCSPNESELYGLGSFVFLVFVCTIILNRFIPRFQEVASIQSVIVKLEIIVKKAFPVFMLLSISTIIFGVYSLINEQNESRLSLLFFIGIVFLYFSINLKKWANENDKLQKRNYVRRMGISISFLTIFVYLMMGAPNLKI